MKLSGAKSKIFLTLIICILVVTLKCDGGDIEFYSTESDTDPPTAPTNVIATATPNLGITLSWEASTDNTRVQGYWIYREDTGYIGQVTDTSYHESGLSPETEYCYYLQAYDPYGNYSSLSETACAITNIEVGKYSSAAIDSNDVVYITYYDQSYHKIKYAENIIGTWGTGDVAGNEEYINATDIAIDSHNNVHISYSECAFLISGSLSYATNTTGPWVTSTIATGVGMGDASIAIDSSDNVHISSSVFYNGGLMYVTNINGSWNKSIIDTVYTGDTSIGIDSNDNVHISYYDSSNDILKYITNASGAWVVSALDTGIFDGISIAVDSNDHLHISYYDSYNQDLKYVTNATGSWVISKIDNNGAYTSIAVDSLNSVHISYYDWGTKADLKYATNASGSWVISTIDSEGVVGIDTDIAIDSNDNVHISYYDYDNGSLKYATNISGSWITYTVDEGHG